MPGEPQPEIAGSLDAELAETIDRWRVDDSGYSSRNLARFLVSVLRSVVYLDPPKSGYIHPRDRGCDLPPPGWFCIRDPGHEGPCAGEPIERPVLQEQR